MSTRNMLCLYLNFRFAICNLQFSIYNSGLRWHLPNRRPFRNNGGLGMVNFGISSRLEKGTRDDETDNGDSHKLVSRRRLSQ